MNKVQFFQNAYACRLKEEVNAFIANKNVINVSYSTERVGFETWHYCCVFYKE